MKTLNPNPFFIIYINAWLVILKTTLHHTTGELKFKKSNKRRAPGESDNYWHSHVLP